MYPNRLADLRDEAELTQEELSKVIGGSRVNISDWETGKETPNINRVNLLANYFNVSLDYIFRLTNDKSVKDIENCPIDRQVVGKRLRSFRKSNNLTLKNLADELNTTPSTLCAYEAGKTLLLTSFALQICQRHKVSMDWLYGKKN